MYLSIRGLKRLYSPVPDGNDMNIMILCTASLLLIVLTFHNINIPESRNWVESQFANAAFDTSQFNKLVNDYLQSWKQLAFQSIFSTYVSGLVTYDVYDDLQQQRGSNVFFVGETNSLPLYVEPVGFTHTEITDENGKKVYAVQMAANATILASNGTLIGSQDFDHIISGVANERHFHHKITNIYLLLVLHQSPKLIPDNYTVTYTVKDVPSGKSFDIVKQIKVVTEKEFCLMPVNRERPDC